jgi:hypothetical protein
MLWDILLLLIGLAMAGLGLVSPANTPIWFASAGVCAILITLRWQRARLGRWLVAIGVLAGGQEAVSAYIPLRPAGVPIETDRSVKPGAAQRLAERREAVRDVINGIAEAMAGAEMDRNHTNDIYRNAAISTANRVASIVHEVTDAQARDLVRQWKVRFDTIPKGRKDASSYTPGYPEPMWTDLHLDSDAATDRLGEVLREMLKD